MLCPTVRTLYLEDPGRGPLPGRSLGTCFPRLETLDIRETRPGLLSVPSGRAHQRIALALAVLFDDPLNKLKKLTLRLASTNPLYDPRYFDQRAQGWAAGRPIGALRNRLCGLKDLTIHISALYLDGNDAYDLVCGDFLNPLQLCWKWRCTDAMPIIIASRVRMGGKLMRAPHPLANTIREL